MKAKRILSAILSICMIASLMIVPTFAEAQPNVSISPLPTRVGVGDTFTVTISNDLMKLAGFACYLEFDADLLECTAITGADGDEYMGLNKTTGKTTWVDATIADTVVETNADGIFSFCIISVDEVEYAAGIVATLTFTAKATGFVSVTLGESSSGSGAFSGTAQEEEVEVHTCVYGENVLANDANLVSAADCVNAYVYTKACECGALDPNGETFVYGTALGHDFATDYSHDADNHWFDCSRCDVDDAKAPHEDADADNICDVCARQLHVHVFDINDKDANGHWTECACGEATTVVPHAYTTKHDANNHWSECACGWTTGVAAHTASAWVYDIIPTMTKPGHKYNYCTVCGRILASETITADSDFVDATFVISATASEGGSITPAGKSYVAWGSDVTYNFQPALGYEVAYVAVNGSYIGKVDSYTFKNVDANQSIYVAFKEIAPAYDDGYVAPPELVVPEPSVPSEPEVTESKTYIAAVAKLAELKAVSTTGCTEASVAVFDAAVLALELAVEAHAEDDVLITLVANAYLAKANLVVFNSVTCDD